MANRVFYFLGDILVVFALHIFCIKMFSDASRTKKQFTERKVLGIRGIAIVFYIAIDCMIYYLFDNAAVFFVSSALLYFAFSMAYSLRFCLKNIIATLLFMIFGVSSELLASFSMAFFVPLFGGDMVGNEIVATTLLSRLLFFIFILLVKQIIDFQNKETEPDKSFLLTPIIPILSIIIVLYLFSLSSFDQQSILESGSLGDFISVIAIVIMNVLAFYVFDRFHRVNVIINEEARLKQTIVAQQARFEEESTVRENIRKMKHDYKNKLIAIQMSIRDNDLEGTLSIIEDELGNVEALQLPNSNNMAIDAIVSYKASIAAEKNIIVIPEYKIKEEIKVDSSDICILIGNALDNAIEYLEKHIECRQQINIKIIAEKGILNIMISNEISDNPEINGNMIETTKKESGHGYGLKSARFIAEKYDGVMDLSCSDKVYSFNVILYI